MAMNSRKRFSRTTVPQVIVSVTLGSVASVPDCPPLPLRQDRPVRAGPVRGQPVEVSDLFPPAAGTEYSGAEQDPPVGGGVQPGGGEVLQPARVVPAVGRHPAVQCCTVEEIQQPVPDVAALLQYRLGGDVQVKVRLGRPAQVACKPQNSV